MVSLYQLLLALLDRAKKISWKLSSNPPNSPEPRKHFSLHQIPSKIWQHHPCPQRQAVAHRPMLLAVTLMWSLQVSNLAVPSTLRSKGLDQGVKVSRLCSEVGQDLSGFDMQAQFYFSCSQQL